MNLKELNSFKLSDAVTFHDKLNPKLWNGTKLRPDVRDQLMLIAQDFLQELGVHDLDVKDITISGSNAAYSYTKHSDLDLHILVDMGNLPVDEVYKELFTAKKTIYNDTHDIKINNIPVELYVQDSRQPVVSLGEYSVMNDQWIRIPTKRRSDFDQTATKSKYEKLLSLIEIALQSKKYGKVKHIIDTIKRYRQAGLDKGGEFGPENLAYKMLRSQGYITKLYDLRDKLHSEKLSFETMYRNVTDEDYDPNGIPPGPETKPTMPRGTVRVDVSDVYDWYKLGQNISNLDRVDPKMFGKGPPSTIVSFGDEDTEHKYINALKNLGLSTTDIDPVDPNQPKGMPRQKVDPTYNVNEELEQMPSVLYHATYKQRLKSIKLNGLGAGGKRNWTDSKRGVVYLALDPHVAESYAETALDDLDADWDIVILQVSTNGLDPNKFHLDSNVQDNEGDTVEYHGIIPPSNISLYKSGVAEEYNTMQFASEKTPAINPYGGLKDNQYRGAMSEASGYIPAKELVQHFLHQVSPKMLKYYSVRDNCGPAALDMIDWAKTQGIELHRVGGYFVADNIVYDKEDFTKEMKRDFLQQGLDFNDSQARKEFIESNPKYSEEWKKIPHYWLQDKQGNVYDPTGYIQFVKTGLSKDLDPVRYEKHRLNEASGYIPSEKEKNDPRFKTALTVDINPYTMKKGAKQFNWDISRAGIPPTAKTNGKIS